MPTVTETPRSDLLCFCNDSRCKGNAMRACQGIEVLTEFTYRERNVNIPGAESSTIRYRFPNEGEPGYIEGADRCKSCQRRLEIGDQDRPVYESLSGHPQDALLSIDKWNGDKTAEVEALVDRLAEKLGNG